MRDDPFHRLDDRDEIRTVIRGYPFATIAGIGSDGGLVVSHMPVMLALPHVTPDTPDAAALTVVGHFGVRDAEDHALGQRPATLVFRGPHAYVSPSWYGDGDHVPTWNYVAVHLTGVPQVLTPQETYAVLEQTVHELESTRPSPWSLETVDGFARQLARGTRGFRLVPDVVQAKNKLSQDKPAHVRRNVRAALAKQSAAAEEVARRMASLQVDHGG